MTELTPVVLALTLVVLGLSYLLQTQNWLKLTHKIRAQPERFFPAAIVMVATGTTIAYGFDSWSGTWPIFVTLFGWLMALEGAVILLLPRLIQKFLGLSDQFMRIYLRLGGVLVVVLGFLLWRELG